MKKVLIIYRFLPQYRVDFYNGLREKLKEHDIELSLVYGRSNNKDSKKGDEVSIDWAEFVPNRKIKTGVIEFLWQPCLKHIKDKDLVIVEQANVLLINYYLMLRRKFGRPKMAFWGHGINQQANLNSLGNRFKKRIIKNADWWFPYTEGVKDIVKASGFDERKISVVENAIDTRMLKRQYEEISNEIVIREKKALNIDSENVGIYCGALYKEKRIDFLLHTAEKIREQVHDFHLIIVGAGPDIDIVQAFLDDRDWIHYVGTKFNADRVIYFKMSKLFLLPGAVGLAVLDAFATQTPMFTTDYPFHGPEVEYIKNNENGIVTIDDADTYVNAVTEVLADKNLHDKLVRGCRESSLFYTVEKMVDNFANGIISCLKS
jgi:glycosyltransferase involved in cell wall biosynthesis